MDKKEYDVTKYDRPSLTVDIVLFSIKNNCLNILLIKRKEVPFKDFWALPGGFVKINESLEDAAKRELIEETNIKDVYLEQLYTFGNLNRDPRTRVITVSYFALMSSKDLGNIKIKPSTDASEVQWFDTFNLPKLAFDHKNIVEYGIKRLRWKLEYTTIGFKLLPENFTLTELQMIYEIAFHKKFDKRNFRKKILSLNLIEETKEKTKDVSHRPAKLYSFKKKMGDIIEII